MIVQVLKRDGSVEEFLPEKIIRVLLAAGLEEDSALTVATNVSDWVKSLNQAQIPTSEIKNRVQSELDIIDPYIAGLFRWYQKTKDHLPALPVQPES